MGSELNAQIYGMGVCTHTWVRRTTEAKRVSLTFLWNPGKVVFYHYLQSSAEPQRKEELLPQKSQKAVHFERLFKKCEGVG